MAIEKKIPINKILSQDFYSRKTDVVARELLGKLIVRKTRDGILAGRIVETEAYFGNGEDPASHAHNGPTPRSAIMFGPAGIAYIYFNYGMHWLLNVVAKEEGRAGAVLFRAIEPIHGVDLMLNNRKTNLTNLTNGPAKLTSALGLDGSINGINLTKQTSELCIFDYKTDDFEVVCSTRIGISKGESNLLRYFIKSNEFVSKQ